MSGQTYADEGGVAMYACTSFSSLAWQKFASLISENVLHIWSRLGAEVHFASIPDSCRCHKAIPGNGYPKMILPQCDTLMKFIN